ncbi:MAG: crotonase/enoyl-CoA hydratase family protein [Desulfosudaceae bacterium]
MTVRTEHEGPVTIITINRPDKRNAVDRPTAESLAAAFRDFEADDGAAVAVLTGAGGHFCAGADLAALAARDEARINRLEPGGDAPMGPSRMMFSKPVIAAVAGYAVAGGLELALLCDLRVAEESAVFGVFCRRWGVPLIDGGTVRLPRLIGLSRALDMILTGRPVPAAEAAQMGLANRVVPDGRARAEAVALARELAAFPQQCLRSDRLSAYEQAGRDLAQAMANEFQRGLDTIAGGETLAGAGRFAAGRGRHGRFESEE